MLAASASAPAADLAADAAILRPLAERKRAIGEDPRQRAAAVSWTVLNDLGRTRPQVLIHQIPWHEFEAADPDVLRPRCRDPWLREVETAIRRELYQWEHFAGDMVIDPVLWCTLVGGPTSVYADYGIAEQADRREGAHDVNFTPQIASPADVERIRRPRVWCDRAETERRRALLAEAVGDAIPVHVRGIVTQWHTPWDMAVHWYGVERLMYDLIDRPELAAAVCERMCTITGEVLDEQERLGMLDVGDGNWLVGSGGLGFSAALPTQVDGRAVAPRDQWGCGNAQVFSEVSAAMHEEFSLRFERPVLERFALSYYGCCEPLHRKIRMLRSIGNLRKISISPKADLAEAAAQVGRDYVLSWKPNPAHLAGDAFDPALVGSYLRQAVAAAGDCNLEIILKDITTSRSDVARLQRWCELAMSAVGA